MVNAGALSRRIPGAWVEGPARGVRAVTVDFLAGRLCTVDKYGGRITGTPDDFRSDSGKSGVELMKELLPSPSTEALYRGAMRQALSNAFSIARIGRQETRDWESVGHYVVDNGEGCMAYVRFAGRDCVCVAFSDDPTREYNPVPLLFSAVPSQLRAIAEEVLELPFFRAGGQALRTSMFWSEAGRIGGAEPWHTLYTYTGDVLRGELLDEYTWLEEAGEYYEVSREIAKLISIRVRGGSLPASPLPISQDLLDVIVPSSAPYRDDALESLLSGGAFTRS